MFQRAYQKQRQVDIGHSAARDVEPTRSTVGKRTLTESQVYGAPDHYQRAIDAARRELRAVRTVALPTFIKTLRRKDLEPLAKQSQLAQTAAQVRHLLMTANQHVRALEKAASYRDPNIAFLRHSVDTLAARAARLGVYRGAEDMLPRPHVETAKQIIGRGGEAQLVRKPDLASQRKKALVARNPVAAAPTWARTSVTTAHRVSSPAAARSVQRKATGASYARDVHAVAARGVEGASQPLPFASQIQRAFGRHDVSNIRVAIGGEAAHASKELGAKAYATGDAIAFASAPDLHTAAHEAAHVVQQRRGASPSGRLDGGHGDSLELHAEAVADAVVAGRSVETLLDSLAIGSSSRAVQRKPEPAATEPDTKYTFRRKSELKFKIGVVPAKLEMRWEVSLKDKGTLRHGLPGAKTDAAYGSNQLLLESSAKGLDAKVSTSLSKVTYDVLADGRLPDELGALPIVPRVELKGLDAGLSIREGWDLKLMTLAVYLDGDFSGLFDESKRSYLEAKGQVRIECALEPDLAKKLVELARATDAVTRSAKLEQKIAKTEKSLRYWRTRRAKDKVAQLEKELGKLRGVREAVNKARDAGLKTIQRVGASLEKTAAGRLVKKLGAKALATAFKKFIPIYNLVSTAHDLYEAGSYLAGLDWGNIGDRIVNGGPGGTVMGDGSHHEGDGVGGELGAGGSGDDVAADAIERELQREANVELHSTAQALVAVLEAQVGGGGQTQTLSKEDKETINFVVPPDLSADEIAMIKARLVEVQGGTRQDLVTTVIEAVQQMRPFGEPIGPSEQPTRDEPKPVSHPEKAPARRRPSHAKVPAKKKPVGPKAGSSTVDLQSVLERLSTLDEQAGVHIPAMIELPGLRARVERSHEFKLTLGTNDQETTQTTKVVSVVITPLEVQSGLKQSDGTRIEVGVPINVAVTVRPRQQGDKQ